MATNSNSGFRIGSVKNRIQVETESGNWIKFDTVTLEAVAVKSDGEPFKGVAKMVDSRRSKK